LQLVILFAAVFEMEAILIEFVDRIEVINSKTDKMYKVLSCCAHDVTDTVC